jgi:hypothetical protein
MIYTAVSNIGFIMKDGVSSKITCSNEKSPKIVILGAGMSAVALLKIFRFISS